MKRSESPRAGSLVHIPGQHPSGLCLLLGERGADGEADALPVLKGAASPGSGFLALPSALAGEGHGVDTGVRMRLSLDPSTPVVGQLPPALLEQILRALVLKDVTLFHDAIHLPKRQTPFQPLDERISCAGRVFDQREMHLLVDASLDFYLTANRYDDSFCTTLGQMLTMGQQDPPLVLTTSSGSSSNLLALTTLTSPTLGEEALQPGDEVITVAAGFPTTIAPILQNRLVPHFVDVEPGTCNIHPDALEAAINGKTRAIMAAHTLGIPMDMDRILAVAEKHGLWVIEDNCDALGARYRLAREYTLIRGKRVGGEAWTGTMGHIGTSSFYPAHHITMGEGGAIYTHDKRLYQIAMSFRDWGRDCWCPTGKDNTCKRRFSWQMGLLPKGYDHKYTYSHLGYNLKITDMQAAVGLAQLEKLPSFCRARLENWLRLREMLADLEAYFILPHAPESATPSPFGFTLTVRPEAGFSREELTHYLEDRAIQTRALFAGNILRQPAMIDARAPLRIAGAPLQESHTLGEADMARLPNTETFMQHTFWVGVYPGLKPGMIEFMADKIRAFIKR